MVGGDEMSKPTVPEVLPLVNEIYKDNSAGCCLHVVLDDYNLSNYFVQSCIEDAKKIGHQKCAFLGEILLKMSTTQRRKLASLHL